jgi:hypothetical protein
LVAASLLTLALRGHAAPPGTPPAPDMAAIRLQFAQKDAEIAALKRQIAALQPDAKGIVITDATLAATAGKAPAADLVKMVQQYDDLMIDIIAASGQSWYDMVVASQSLDHANKVLDSPYTDGGADAAQRSTEGAGAQIDDAKQCMNDLQTMVPNAVALYHAILNHAGYAAFYQTGDAYFSHGYKEAGIMTDDASLDDLLQIIRR